MGDAVDSSGNASEENPREAAAHAGRPKAETAVRRRDDASMMLFVLRGGRGNVFLEDGKTVVEERRLCDC